MANESGTPSAPQKAAEKSGNVSGAQAVQMIVKRQSAAAETPPSAEHAEPVPEKSEPETPIPSASSEETPKTSPPEKGEAPEPKAEKPEGEGDQPDEVLSKLSPEQRERIDRRIAKEVGKRKALEDEVSRLRILANATQPPPAPVKAVVIETTSDNPLANVLDATELLKQQTAAEETKYWAQEQLDDDNLTEVKVGDRTYSRSELKAVVRNSERMLSKMIPQRMQFLQSKAASDKQTMETFGSEPWMKDRSSEGYQAYQQIMADPDIAKRANSSWVAAIQVQGLLDLQRRQRATGKEVTPAPKPKAPGSQTATGAGFGPAREASESKAVKALQADLERLKGKKGVTGKDLQGYFQKMENARSTR